MNKWRMTFPRLSLVFFVIFIVFLFFILTLDQSGSLINQGAGQTIERIFQGLLNIDLSSRTLSIAWQSAIQTLVYALIALSLSFVFGLIFGVLASGVVSNPFVASFFSGVLRFARSIHELIWAWFFVFAMGNNPIAGLLALSIPYTGGLGKQFSDALRGVDQRPILALNNVGASKMQTLIYGYLPLAFKDMLTYTIFRFEMAVRSTTVLSFVGLGGLGFYLQLAIQDLEYPTMWTYLIVLIIMVSLINWWGNTVRRRVNTIEN